MIIFYGLRLYKNELRLYKNEHRLFVMKIYFMNFDFVFKIWNNIVTLVFLSALGKHSYGTVCKRLFEPFAKALRYVFPERVNYMKICIALFSFLKLAVSFKTS